MFGCRLRVYGVSGWQEEGGRVLADARWRGWRKIYRRARRAPRRSVALIEPLNELRRQRHVAHTSELLLLLPRSVMQQHLVGHD